MLKTLALILLVVEPTSVPQPVLFGQFSKNPIKCISPKDGPVSCTDSTGRSVTLPITCDHTMITCAIIWP